MHHSGGGGNIQLPPGEVFGLEKEEKSCVNDLIIFLNDSEVSVNDFGERSRSFEQHACVDLVLLVSIERN
jgi:hypothetical protein